MRALPRHIRIAARRAVRQRMSARRSDPVADVLDCWLAADAPDPVALVWLADRGRFAQAARALRLECRVRNLRHDVLPILADPHNSRLRLGRLALEFGAAVAHQRRPITISGLRAAARRGHQGAALALAANGEPIKAFAKLSRPERAAYALGRLVSLQRGGAP